MSAAETPVDMRTSRHREIVELVEQGLPTDKIAELLGLTEWTVRWHARKAGLRRRGSPRSGTTDFRESETARAKRLELDRQAMFRCKVCRLIEPCLTNHDEKPDPWARRSSWTDGA